MDGGNIILTILGLFLAPYMLINIFWTPPDERRKNKHKKHKN
jgi:hypothetical protein